MGYILRFLLRLQCYPSWAERDDTFAREKKQKRAKNAGNNAKVNTVRGRVSRVHLGNLASVKSDRSDAVRVGVEGDRFCGDRSVRFW